MSLVVFVVLGAVIGLLAHALLPEQAMDGGGGLPLVIAGAVAGGVLVTLLGGLELGDVRSINIVGSLAGALATLGVTAAARGRVGA